MALRRWMPDEGYPSVYDVPWERLKAQGIQAVLLDLDNTLGPWGVTALEARALALLDLLRRTGFAVGILSNARRVHQRTKLLQQLQGVPLVCAANKPSTLGFSKLLARLGSPAPEMTVMVGDQWFTDVLGAKRLGMRAVLVEPFDPASEPWWARLRRKVERLIVFLPAPFRSPSDGDRCR